MAPGTPDFISSRGFDESTVSAAGTATPAATRQEAMFRAELSGDKEAMTLANETARRAAAGEVGKDRQKEVSESSAAEAEQNQQFINFSSAKSRQRVKVRQIPPTG